MNALEQLVDTYVKAPAELRAVVKGMSREQLMARPVAGRWSTIEVVAHIADFEPVLTDRMKRIISQDGTPPLLLAMDENRLAATMGYQDRDVEEELQLIETTRKSMARVLRRLTTEQLQATGVHSLRGLLTLERVLQMANNHIPHHLPFIAAKKLALGIS